jgi:endo-1,4-beta-xylanase
MKDPDTSTTSNAAALVATLILACGSPTAIAQPETLQAAFKDAFLVGGALNEAQFTERDARGAALAAAQFNTITPENVMKWGPIHPEPGRYAFAAADRYVEFGEKHGMFIVGHTLVWHQQTPEWVFEHADGTPLDRHALLERMRDHIHTVVGRYKGRVHGWDVVNEALNEDGTLRPSPWMKIIGEDYLEKAFQFAHEADPAAELYYNDYSLENEPKRKGAVALIKRLQAAGLKVHGIGTQQHIKMDWPTAEQVDDTLEAFGNLGIKVMVTELDVDVLPSRSRDRSAEVSRRLAADPALNPYTNGLPDSVQQALADRYAGLFAVYLKHRATLDRVTFWGVTDGDSWLNNWPIRGRTAYPLLFDRQGQPKPAFDAVLATVAPRE